METKEKTHAQAAIRERIFEKIEWNMHFQDYSDCSNNLMRSEYGDYSHGDYSDYYRNR